MTSPWITRRVLCTALAATVFVTAGSRFVAAGSHPASAVQAELEDRLAQGKLEADLGHHQAAAREFAAVAAAPEAPPALRAEAVARLGAVRRAAGDAEGAIRAFEEGWSRAAAARESETLSLLVRALGEALPSPGRWEKIWQRVALTVDRTDPARPLVRVVWPDVPRQTRLTGAPATSLDLKDGDLMSVLRLFADISKLNMVVFPGAYGKVTLNVKDRPWDEVLELVLAPNGLTFRVEGPVIRIGTPEQLGAASKFSGTAKFSGKRIDLDLKDRDLREVLESLAETGGGRADIDPVIGGRVTLKLHGVPWDQALDLVARTNGLEWSRSGDVMTFKPRPRR